MDHHQQQQTATATATAPMLPTQNKTKSKNKKLYMCSIAKCLYFVLLSLLCSALLHYSAHYYGYICGVYMFMGE